MLFIIVFILIVGVVSCCTTLCHILRQLRANRNSLRALHSKLNQVLVLLNPVEEAATLLVYVNIDGNKVRLDQMGNLKKEQRVEILGVEAKTKSGKPAKLDGEPVFSVPDGLEIVEADGKKFLQAKDDAVEGPVVLAVDADGDMSEGVKNLHAEVAVNILAADAATMEIKLGASEDIP